MRFGSRGPSEFFSQIRHRNASLGVVSLVFRGLDLLKIVNFDPQQEARFLLWKKLVPQEIQESGGNGV